MDAFISRMFSSKVSSNDSCIYVSETNNLSARLTLHFNGSVNSSAFRELVALRMGFDIIKRMEGVGNRIIKKIESKMESDGEHLISRYIQTGFWTFISFPTLEESKDFFWYTCERLKPALINHLQSWNSRDLDLYKRWFESLIKSEKINFQDLSKLNTRSAVCAFFHEQLPEQFLKSKV